MQSLTGMSAAPSSPSSMLADPMAVERMPTTAIVPTQEDLIIDDTLSDLDRVVKYGTNSLALQRLVHTRMIGRVSKLEGCVGGICSDLFCGVVFAWRGRWVAPFLCSLPSLFLFFWIGIFLFSYKVGRTPPPPFTHTLPTLFTHPPPSF